MYANQARSFTAKGVNGVSDDTRKGKLQLLKRSLSLPPSNIWSRISGRTRNCNSSIAIAFKSDKQESEVDGKISKQYQENSLDRCCSKEPKIKSGADFDFKTSSKDSGRSTVGVGFGVEHGIGNTEQIQISSVTPQSPLNTSIQWADAHFEVTDSRPGPGYVTETASLLPLPECDKLKPLDVAYDSNKRRCRSASPFSLKFLGFLRKTKGKTKANTNSSKNSVSSYSNRAAADNGPSSLVSAKLKLRKARQRKVFTISSINTQEEKVEGTEADLDPYSDSSVKTFKSANKAVVAVNDVETGERCQLSGVCHVEMLDGNKIRMEHDKIQRYLNVPEAEPKSEAEPVRVSKVPPVSAKEKLKRKEDNKNPNGKNVRVPPQTKMIHSLLYPKPDSSSDNGLIREYYSHVLRSRCPINMQGRYRGMDPDSECFQPVDMSKLLFRRIRRKEDLAKKK